MTNELLKKLYYDVKNPASFSSAEKLYHEAVKQDPSIKISDVKKWLSSQFTYTLHKQKRNVFQRNKIKASHVNEQWEADLVDLQEFKKKNNGFCYLLTIIDVFSKYAYVKALKTKSAKEVTLKFKQVFDENLPIKIRTDKGKEFLNSSLQNLFKKYKIMHFTPENIDIKCSIVERFNRTLKSKMFKYFTSKGTRKYIDVLDLLVESYNNSHHRSIKMKPSEVDASNEKIVFKNLYGFDDERDFLINTKKPKYKIGDVVRIKYNKKVFDKSYFPNWTDQIYKIFSISKSSYKPYYILKTYNEKKIIKKRFYEEEIQKVEENTERIEKILKKKKEGNKIFYFVKWLNYPNEYNSWVPIEDIEKLNNGN